MNGFSLWVGFGAALGLWRIARGVPQRQAEVWVNAGLMILFAALIGARLFYAWINRAYFSAHLIEIPQIWLGGLSWPGAVGAAWIAILYLSITHPGPRGKPISPGWLADHLYPLLPTLSIGAWLGSWMVGTAYGPEVPAGAWWGIHSLDEAGADSLRWPLQPLSALSLLLFFWLVETKVKPLQPAGLLSGLAVSGLLVNLLLTSFLRADPTPFWNGIRMDTWMAAFYIACFLLFIALSGLAAWLRGKQLVTRSSGT